MVERVSIQTNQIRSYLNLYNNDTNLIYNLSESNLDFAIGIRGYLEEGVSLSSYLTIQAKFFDNTYDKVNSTQGISYENGYTFIDLYD